MRENIIEDRERVPSVDQVYHAILEGHQLASDVVKATGLSERTVRYALKILLTRGLIKKKPDLLDMRKWRFVPAKSK
ncbi:MAG: hypothetical protein QXL15_03955 [Candidatus Korarchaeota archaeon]